jgi:hypothetical protein
LTGVLLRTPQSWIDRFLEVELDELILSYYPNGVAWPVGRSERDVAGDLAAGAWLSRAPGSRNDVFRLGGTEFELRVQRRRGKGEDRSGSGPWMAVVQAIDLAGSVPRRARILPRVVAFEKVWEETPCDLAEIEEMLRERERQWREINRRPAPLQGEVRAHGRLQDKVRTQYGELDTLIAVLEQRPERAEDSAVGTLRPPQDRRRGRQPAIVVELLVHHEGRSGLFRGKRVQLECPDGSSFNTRVTYVRDGLLEIAEPRGWSGRLGEQVVVSVVRPFGMRQNAEALKRFKEGSVEGSWDDLARLLCRPADLLLPGEPELPVFYCDDDPDVPNLNAEQRRAVAGAVTSPHAFLIQGPPGTGKTEVIGETIRQLVGRGQRVLLLAPTHVAVDEVLGRIGKKPGVRPLRITWDDDLVAEDLRGFLPEQVGVEAAQQILRPADHGQVGRWAREFDMVEAKLTVVAELRQVIRRRLAAAVARDEAARVAAAAGDRLRARIAASDAELARGQRALADDDRALATAQAAARGAVEVEQHQRALTGPALAGLGEAGAELARSSDAADEASRAVEHVDRELWSWRQSHEAELARVVHDLRHAEQAVWEAQHQSAAADRAAADARTRLSQAVARQSALGRFAEQFGLGRVARARTDAAEADAAAGRCRLAWSHRHATWRDLAQAHDRLRQFAASRLAALEQQRAGAYAAREAARQRLADSVRTFTEALAAAGGEPASIRASTAADWARLGNIVRAAIAAVQPHVETVVTMPEVSALEAVPGVEAVAVAVAVLRRAATDRAAREQDLAVAAQHRDDRRWQLQQEQAQAAAEIERLTAERDAAERALGAREADLAALVAERQRLVAELGFDDPAAGAETLQRRHHVLQRLPGLDVRWRELAGERSDEQFVADIQHSLIRATNLVCATTKGIVSRGSEIVRHTDYDTLIVDEASRVTESEFLIGAIRARRWVLVGDERQLPPHVDQEDEHFLHALTALHRVSRGAAATLEQAVDDLAGVWEEDEHERVYRKGSVQKIADELDSSGRWHSTFREHFTQVQQFFGRGKGDDTKADRRILQAMRRYLVQSLFELAVAHSRETLRQPLILQRRMIEPLAKIVKEPIYGGRYDSPPDEELAKVGVTPLVIPRFFDRPATLLDTSHYADAIDSPVKHGFVNRREQELILRTCEIYNEELRTPVTVSVLSFYLAQARELERQLREQTLPMLQWEVIDVIDRIQGQQSDLVVLSFTRAAPAGFGDRYGQWLQDIRRLNVACTRARRALVLVGHARTLSRLRTFERARQFYANMLGLFDSDRENFKRIHHLD